MAQLIQYKPTSTLNGSSEILTIPQVASNRRLLERSEALAVKKLEAELNEHRYYLERKVEQRTEQLVKRLILLESCNTTLCEKLAQAKREMAELQKLVDSNLSGTEEKVCSGQETGKNKGPHKQAKPDAVSM